LRADRRGVTLPPIVFLQYLGLTEGKTQFHIAWERFVEITIGIAAAVVIGMWLWPIHARVQYFSAVADTMDQITEYCELKGLGHQLTQTSACRATSSARHSYTRRTTSSTPSSSLRYDDT
jgi:uncharacterized membrane protein YccC